MLDAKEIGCRLRELRGNIPRETVADAVGISVSAISCMKMENVSLVTLLK